MPNLKDFISNIEGTYTDTNNSTNSGTYQKLATILNNSKSQLREYMQNITRNDTSKIIQKLESGRDITPEELKLIKLWLIGDAEYYTKLENNYNDWLNELKRIIGEIQRISETEESLDTINSLIAMLEDGIRVVHDIIFLLEKKERIKAFEESTQQLDKSEREVLVRLLRGKLTSKDI